AESRMPTSPSLAARRASSSSCKSFFLISTVPLSAARPLEADARLAALLLRVWVSRAATVGSFVARDGSAGGPLGDASAGYAEAVRPRGRKSYLCTRKPPGISRAWARSSLSSSTGSRPTLRRRRPAGPGLEDRADAAQAGGVRDHPE